MFLRTLQIDRIAPTGQATPIPIAQLDSFAMRNFTNDAVFDDTLPVADGRLEAGLVVPLDHLLTAMEEWFRRKRYLAEDEHLRIAEIKHSV